MEKSFIFDPQVRKSALWGLCVFVLITVIADVFGHAVMTI